MNIRDSSQRKVVCVKNEGTIFFACDRNSHLLKVGETYNVANVDVHGWHTEVELKEFPNKVFNSACFKEKGGAE